MADVRGWIARASIGALGLAMPVTAQPPVDETLVPYASTADSAVLPDGRTLHLVCMGKGAPVVLFTAGANGWSGEWSHVQPEIAKGTRTCAWDRAGFGLSDGTTTPMTVATATRDLEDALTAARITAPYVLVGQSLGAYETLLFADRNKAKVGGIVLVDPSVPDQGAIAARLRDAYHFKAPEPPAGAPVPPSFAGIWRRCGQEVREGRLKAGGPDPHGCLAILQPPIPPVVAAAVAAKLTSNPAQFESMAAFSETGLEDGQKIVVNPARNYGAIPLLVLTATALPPDDQKAFWQASLQASIQAHDALAALSTRGTNRVVPDAGHNMHMERSQLVIDAIRTVVAQARGTPAR